MDFALGVLLGGRPELAKSACPTTTSAGTSLVVGIRFQIRTRLWLVSATTRCTPSEATAVGSRRLFCEAVRFSVIVVKSGCPSTTVARPTQTGHLPLYGRSAVGLGSWLERLPKSRTRWFDG